MASGYKPNFITSSVTADTTLDHFFAGTNLVLNAASGLTITLPAATGSGASFDFIVGTTVTSNSYIVQAASASDTIQGAVAIASDIGGVSCPTTATTDTITVNGTTTGGKLGTSVRLVDVASGVWAVSGALVASGTEATPFSAAVN